MNKEFRYFRTHHARKGSLKDNLKDVFDRSAQCASPQIFSQIEASLFPKNRKQRPFPVSVKPLFLYPNLYEFEEPRLLTKCFRQGIDFPISNVSSFINFLAKGLNIFTELFQNLLLQQQFPSLNVGSIIAKMQPCSRRRRTY